MYQLLSYGVKRLMVSADSLFFTILNHVTKHPAPSLDKDSAKESKACDLAKVLDPEKETLFCFDLL